MSFFAWLSHFLLQHPNVWGILLGLCILLGICGLFWAMNRGTIPSAETDEQMVQLRLRNIEARLSRMDDYLSDYQEQLNRLNANADSTEYVQGVSPPVEEPRRPRRRAPVEQETVRPSTWDRLVVDDEPEGTKPEEAKPEVECPTPRKRRSKKT